MLIDLNLLLEYTDWERQKWHESLRQHGDRILLTTTGANSDARFETVGDLVRHIFSAEKRYVERLSDKPLTDTASVSTENLEQLFQFGEESRKALREFIEGLPAQQWDAPREFVMANHPIRATPKKLLIHVLLHEIRHWAQIATLLRQNGLKGEFHDFLFSPALGGDARLEQVKA
jgi:uncharacterized damage-inducible protein DinB